MWRRDLSDRIVKRLETEASARQCQRILATEGYDLLLKRNFRPLRFLEAADDPELAANIRQELAEMRDVTLPRLGIVTLEAAHRAKIACEVLPMPETRHEHLNHLGGWEEIRHQLRKRGLPIPKIPAASQTQQRPRDRGGYER